jgi:alanine-synthesizing transaminase
MFSRRAHWNAPQNRLTLARQSRPNLLDLTESNPTKASIDYPLDELSEIFARAARAAYEPEPLGLRSAREALGDPEQIVLTSSTSEAYAYLFKLLTDPGDAILTATPSYPLLEHLASLELIEQHSFPLELHKRWEIERSRVAEALTPRTRAIVVVNPNNPTGSYVTPREQDDLASFGLPLISDEVFFDYAVGPEVHAEQREASTEQPRETSPSARSHRRSLAALGINCETLTFTLGGLSKSAGLPHYKLGWIRVSGPGAREAIDALELIADNYLSVATPVQTALPELLAIAPRIREAIRARTQENLDILTRAIELAPSARLLPVEGGWSAVVRVPSIESDEELALRFIDECGVVVHPGYFFDFDSDGYFVVSLLTRPDVFAEGIARVVSIIPA